MIKTFDEARKESTCQKRTIICEIYDNENNLLSRESNRCSPDGGVCHRIGVVQGKCDYDKESSCNWIHAEIMAIKSLAKKCAPYRAVVYGHTFFCDNCENELRSIGVSVFEIGNA